MLPLYYDPIYTDGIAPEARFPRERYRLLYERLKTDRSIDLRQPRLATRAELELGHAPAFVDQFLTGNLPTEAIRQIGLRPWTDSIIERTLRITGGSFQALEHVLEHGGLAGNMAGGTHHAYRSFGSGYCIFNDIALCAIKGREHPDIERVLVLDVDVHQGDGTAAICASHEDIFTCSIHAESNFPFRKQQSDLDVHLCDDIGDKDYLSCLDATLDKIGAHDFDLILYQAGVDPLQADALGRLSLSREGLDARNQRVFKLWTEHNIPIVIFMGGGYAKPIKLSIDAFEDLFRRASRVVKQST
ncbi:MAG: histone deacetylase [Coraliomargarita sp.]